jgi:hypothetical protein
MARLSSPLQGEESHAAPVERVSPAWSVGALQCGGGARRVVFSALAFASCQHAIAEHDPHPCLGAGVTGAGVPELLAALLIGGLPP